MLKSTNIAERLEVCLEETLHRPSDVGTAGDSVLDGVDEPGVDEARRQDDAVHHGVADARKLALGQRFLAPQDQRDENVLFDT